MNVQSRAYMCGRPVEHVTCLPVPEKAQAQYIFCVFPVNADGIHTPSDDTVPAEQILWTVPNTTLKTTQVSGSLSIESEDTYRSLLIRILNRCLAPLQKQVVVPNEKEFASPTTQTYRKGEKAVHVKAFRGSKDGKCFFSNEKPIKITSRANMSYWRYVSMKLKNWQ